MEKKFSGLLLVSDLDDTLLTSGNKIVTEENKKAIEYFKDNGGLFTFSTGRTQEGVQNVLEKVEPNVPIICYNGGAIYDVFSSKFLYGEYLGKDAIEILKFAEEMFPNIGMEVCTDNCIYFCSENEYTKLHRKDERIKETFLNYRNVFSPWKKIVFPDSPEVLDKLNESLRASEFAKKYDFVRSDKHYYEVLPKGISKGSALLKLAEILEIDINKTIAVGDNQNDIQMLKNAGIGVAVANATSEARDAADYITVDNNSNAIAAVITSFELGRIKFN